MRPRVRLQPALVRVHAGSGLHIPLNHFPDNASCQLCAIVIPLGRCQGPRDPAHVFVEGYKCSGILDLVGFRKQVAPPPIPGLLPPPLSKWDAL